MPDLEPKPVAQSDFLLWREVDRLDKRIDDTGKRLDSLDQFGTRGIDGLRAEVRSLREDWNMHEAQHQQTTANIKWAIGLTIGAVVAAVGPLYPVLLYRLH